MSVVILQLVNVYVVFPAELIMNYKDSLYVNNTPDGAIFATVPLSDGTWDHLPFKTLVSYKNGEPFLSGKEHEGEYIPDEQAIRAIFLAYAGL